MQNRKQVWAPLALVAVAALGMTFCGGGSQGSDADMGQASSPADLAGAPPGADMAGTGSMGTCQFDTSQLDNCKMGM